MRWLVVALLLTSPAVAKPAIPFAYRIEVEVIKPDNSQEVIDIGFGTTDFNAALNMAEQVNKDGFCLIVEEDKLLAATCYPPVRLVRTQVIKSWY